MHVLWVGVILTIKLVNVRIVFYSLQLFDTVRHKN